ncbi:MAG: hypothetical protein ACRD30_00570 [Bryobacteraceae bacterium]
MRAFGARVTVLFGLGACALGQTYNISTLAGGGAPNQALYANVYYVTGVAIAYPQIGGVGPAFTGMASG